MGREVLAEMFCLGVAQVGERGIKTAGPLRGGVYCGLVGGKRCEERRMGRRRRAVGCLGVADKDYTKRHGGGGWRGIGGVGCGGGKQRNNGGWSLG